MAGWEFMDKRSPNAGHAAVAELERLGRVERLITQNVDRLHHRAGSVNVCELHGTIFEVECTGCRTIYERDAMQSQLKELNPHWNQVVELAQQQLSSEAAPFAPKAASRSSDESTTRPDGDVELDSASVDYSTLKLPACGDANSGNQNVETCDGFLKPGVVLFGENVPKERVESAMTSLLASDALLILGTSVQVRTRARLCLRDRVCADTLFSRLASTTVDFKLRLWSIIPLRIGLALSVVSRAD
jgi:NAD-dependent SIR2 family protein deacetylase